MPSIIDLAGTLRRLSTAVAAPIVSLAALIASLGNATADMEDVTQGEDGAVAAFLKNFRALTRGHTQVRICLIVPDLANIASDAPNTAIKAQLDIIGSVSMLDEAGVDDGFECWGYYDLIVVGSNTYAGFTNANLDDLILTKIPIMVCNSAVAEHLKMGTATTQSASTVNEWCKTIYNRMMYLIFGSAGDKALFTEATVSDRLDMSDASLTDHLLMTSLTGDTNTTAVVGSLPIESGTGVLYNLDDGTEMPSSRLFAGCFVNADKLTALGNTLLRRMARNFIQVSTTPSITLKANASLLAKIYQDTNELENDWTNGGRLDNLLDAVITDTEDIQSILGTPANFMADVTALALEATLGTHDTDIKALLATIAGYIDTEIAAIITSQGRQLFSMDFWSDLAGEVVVTGTQATVTAGISDVVVADLPATATIVRAVAMMKFRMIENLDSENVNKLDAASALPMQVDDSGNTGMLTCIDFIDDALSLAASAREGGDVIIGDIDVAARVDGNDTYDFQWLNAKADHDSLQINDVQMGLRIWYSI